MHLTPRRLIPIYILILLLPCAWRSAHAQLSSTPLDDRIERRVDDLLRRMTLEEKIGQLVQYSTGRPTGPGTGRADYREQIAKGQLGSLLNLTGAAETNALQRLAVEQSRLHIPLLFGLDVIHGYRTIFPVPIAMASTWDPGLVERASRFAAREATKEGIRWTFSPMVDIARDARWGRIVEGAGEDPYLGSALAAAYVRGYQGEHLSDSQSMAACAKHFVGYGAAEGGRDYNTVDISEPTLRQTYLPPFRAAVDAGAATIMSAFNSLNGVPASANPRTLNQILRQEWGFRGFVVSDWDAIGELINHGVATDGTAAGQKAMLAGVDMDMESSLYSRYLAELVHSRQVPESALDEAVRRVLRVKFALGLFEHPYTEELPEGAKHPVDAEAVELARTVAERSFVLLKNSEHNGRAVLPLQSGVRTIALIGPLADSPSQMLGSWKAMGDPKDVVTLRSALASRMEASGGRVLYAKGTEILSPSDSGFAEAIHAAANADVVVMALGEDAVWMSGEAGSRAHLDLPGNQQQLLEAVAGAGKPVVLLVFSGRPLALTWPAAHLPAILQVWFPGGQAGVALVRTLFGDVSPSGKLTVSIPRSVGQEPLYYNTLNTGRPPEGVDLRNPPSNPEEKYHSRYVDEQNAPLFPFGYGLTYTHFAYSPVEVSTSSISADALNSGKAQPLRISATVRNDGSRPGDEIVQLYIRLQGTTVARPVKELKGFRRLSLTPGESERVEFSLGRAELAFWNINLQNAVEPARVTVWIGPSSADGRAANFVISK
jgi:beta-glucosidase